MSDVISSSTLMVLLRREGVSPLPFGEDDAVENFDENNPWITEMGEEVVTIVPGVLIPMPGRPTRPPILIAVVVTKVDIDAVFF